MAKWAFKISATDRGVGASWSRSESAGRAARCICTCGCIGWAATAGQVIVAMLEQKIFCILPHEVLTAQQVIARVEHYWLPELIEDPGRPAYAFRFHVGTKGNTVARKC